MEQVAVFAKDQMSIPKAMREALNLTEGTKLSLEVRGNELVLSKQPAWQKLHIAAADEAT